MKVNGRMYTTLFNSVTDCIDLLERLEKEIKGEKRKLMQAQQISENLYLGMRTSKRKED